MPVALASFAVAAVLIVLLPGPDSLVVVRGLVRNGRRGGTVTAAGVLCGLVVWVAAAALGLSALLRASETGYVTLKIIGAAYLISIGVQSLGRSGARPATPTTDPMPRLGRSGFAAGFLTDILNPKVGVFFISFLPGFVPHGYPVGPTTLAFGALFVVLTALYFAGLVGVSARSPVG